MVLGFGALSMPNLKVHYNMAWSLFLPLLGLMVAPIRTVPNMDTISSGNYLIHLCNSGEPDSHASYLQQLLPQIYTHLQAVIADSHLGTASQHGYGPLFKTNDSIEEVVGVYQHMAAGTDIMIPAIPSRRTPGLLTARPTLVCVNDSPSLAALYHLCVYDHPDEPMLHWEDSNLIALCPNFWAHKEMTVPRSDCPRLRGGSLSPNNMALALNQQAMIVHELARMYQNTTNWPDEVMNIQDAVNLNATASLRNANNYASYYAGQSIDLPERLESSKALQASVKPQKIEVSSRYVCYEFTC